MAINAGPPDPWLPAGIQEDRDFSDKYLIEHQLGIGGSGVVVCARDRRLDVRVAIKFLLPAFDARKATARFLSEARAATRVTNEHAVRIKYIAKTANGIPYIVMEYLDGVDLERMLQQTPNRQLPIHDAIDFILQACEAIGECHSLGIVHRDLKPSNLFCAHGADGLPMIKVLDFGISKVSTSVDTSTTGGGRILGSPRHMSPEQFESAGDVDCRTDVWAIGVILYEVLTGKLPFDEGNIFRLRQSIRLRTPSPMSAHRRDLPAAVQLVVSKCLEKERNRRYRNVAELARGLAACAPSRSRTSIARILRIVEAPGCSTGSLPLGGGESVRPASSVVSPMPSWVRHRLERTSPWGSGLIAFGAGSALVAGWMLSRHWVDLDLHVGEEERAAVLMTLSEPALTPAEAMSGGQVSNAAVAQPAPDVAQLARNEAINHTASAVSEASASYPAHRVNHPLRDMSSSTNGRDTKIDKKSRGLPFETSAWPANARNSLTVLRGSGNAATSTGMQYEEPRDGPNPSPIASVSPGSSPWIIKIVEERKGCAVRPPPATIDP